MNNVLGIDLGTSSVKIIQIFQDGSTKKVKETYEEISPQGWWKAVCQALMQLDLRATEGIGLSSQVGTYIINGTDVISWSDGRGKEEMEWVRQTYDQEVFLREISMPYPSIISYPIGRLKYIKEHFPDVEWVCQPKDYICGMLTGNPVTDPYSWRGLANLHTKQYSSFFLDEIGFSKDKLPAMVDWRNVAGYTRKNLIENHVPYHIPVYVGLNDYYASLLGMGIEQCGDMFDITGTSEHLGIIEKQIAMDSQMVSGPYLQDMVHYGVTASSGVSLDYGLSLLEDGHLDLEKMVRRNPPIFLPYLNGERAPIWDGDARGVFFGIGSGCTREDMAYAVFEGVVFSLYHIYEHMGKPPIATMKIGGGAAVNDLLNEMKAELFGVPVCVLKEKDTSALGAGMIAAVGCNWYATVSEAIEKLCVTDHRIEPVGRYRNWLMQRFEVYKGLYPALKEQYQNFKEIKL